MSLTLSYFSILNYIQKGNLPASAGSRSVVNSFATARAAKDRSLQREMMKKIKIADFRKDWLDELRSELAELIQLSGKDFTTKGDDLSQSDHVFDLYALVSKIQLRLNPADENFESLRETLERCTTAVDLKELARAHANIVTIGRKILKAEWEKLKTELDSGNDEAKETP